MPSSILRSNPVKFDISTSLVNVVEYEDGSDKFIVAPCIAVIPGVRNDSYISLSVIRDSVEDWEDKPIIIYHSEDKDGNAVLYSNPENVNHSQIGFTRNPRIENGKLKVDCWISENLCNKVGSLAWYIVDQAKNEEILEVSIGFLAMTYEKTGLFDGKVYNEIIERVSPDHLAILPFAKGACSNTDGCGFPRAMKRIDFMALKKLKPIVDSGYLSDPEGSAFFNYTPDEETEISKEIKSKVDEHVDSFIVKFSNKLENLFNKETKTIPLMTARDKEINLMTLIRDDLTDREIWEWHLVAIEDDSVTINDRGELKKKSYSMSEDVLALSSEEWQRVQMSTTFVPYAECHCNKMPEAYREYLGNNNPEKEEIDGMEDTLKAFLDENKLTKEGILQAVAYQEKSKKQLIEKAKGLAKEAELEVDGDMSIETAELLISYAEKTIAAKQPIIDKENPAVYPRAVGHDDGQVAQYAERPKMIRREVQRRR